MGSLCCGFCYTQYVRKQMQAVPCRQPWGQWGKAVSPAMVVAFQRVPVTAQKGTFHFQCVFLRISWLHFFHQNQSLEDYFEYLKYLGSYFYFLFKSEMKNLLTFLFQKSLFNFSTNAQIRNKVLQ